ncbi:MAG: hypothetical protein EBU81_08565 [Proteobacteria bacterium]|nr:hypothetical protein [Pseudomonadota bacterium]
MAERRPPAWHFRHDRQHWTVRDATDSGFPMSGAWTVQLGEHVAHLESGGRCWRAEEASSLKLRVASTGGPMTTRIYWKRSGDNHFDRDRSVPLELAGDGQVRSHRVELASAPGYRGLITGLAIEAGPRSRSGDTLTLHSIELVRAKPRK